MQMARREVCRIPNLFRYQAHALGEVLKRAEIRTGVASGGDFVVPALAGEQRPRTPRAPARIGAAVCALAVAVVVVATPAGAEGRVHLEHGIHDAQGILDDGVVRATNPVPHHSEKTGLNDLS